MCGKEEKKGRGKEEKKRRKGGKIGDEIAKQFREKHTISTFVFMQYFLDEQIM